MTDQVTTNVQIEVQPSSENNNVVCSPDESTTQATTPSITTQARVTLGSDQEAQCEVEILEEGYGGYVTHGASVTIHYNGTLEDGTVFDSSYTRGSPLTFKVGEGKVIKGLEQAIVNL